jgi:hypothetical protein
MALLMAQYVTRVDTQTRVSSIRRGPQWLMKKKEKSFDAFAYVCRGAGSEAYPLLSSRLGESG